MKTILDREFHLHPSDDKTNLCVDFPLTEDFAALEFVCDYSPKELDDPSACRQLIEKGLSTYLPPEKLPPEGGWQSFMPLVNHVTFSLDCDGEYVGCAHRHAPRQTHRISADHSSPGFFRRAAARGNWRVVLNIHALISPEVRYHLTVLGLSEKEAAH